MPPKTTRQLPNNPLPVLDAKVGILGRIAPIGFDRSEGIKILLYGRSGTGKTTLWATFPKPILAVICSGGDKPGELRSIDTPEYRKTIHQVVLKSTNEMADLGDYLRSGESPYQTVVLDHVTGFQDKILAEILGLAEVPAQKYWGLATQAQYGQVSMQAKELLRPFFSLPTNFVIVAQERTFGGKEEGSELIAPSVGAGVAPSLAGWLNSTVDYVGQMFVRGKVERGFMQVGSGKDAQQVPTITKLPGVDYCLRTAPHEVYMTKFRQPKGQELPEAIIDPDYDKLMELIRAGFR